MRFLVGCTSLKMAVDFKNEEEVKEYIENLGIEYRFGCFSEKNPKVCHLLGDYLTIIKKDYHKAARIYKTNCDDENFPKSCHSYGSYLFSRRKGEKNSIAEIDIGCPTNFMKQLKQKKQQNFLQTENNSCVKALRDTEKVLGRQRGKRIKSSIIDYKSQQTAYNYFLKACSLGIGSSCYNAGQLLFSSFEKGPKKDYKKGIELIEKSCTLENAHACNFLSILFLRGKKFEDYEVLQDMTKAFEYAKKACDLDHMMSCKNLFIMYKKGEGVEQNEEMAKKIHKKILDLKEQMESAMTIDFQRGTGKF